MLLQLQDSAQQEKAHIIANAMAEAASRAEQYHPSEDDSINGQLRMQELKDSVDQLRHWRWNTYGIGDDEIGP